MASSNDLVITNRRLDELWLHVLYKCNLQCRHCLFSCSPEREAEGEMTLAQCQEYVQEAFTQGVKSIYLTGGEPLLWTHLAEFLNWYYGLPEVLPLTVLTNGTLIGPGEAAFFSSFAVQGLKLRISLECYTQSNHDEYRGKGSFYQALEGIRYLNQCGIRPWIAYVNKSGGTLDPCGAEKLEEDFRSRLAKDYGLEIDGLKIIAAYSKGRFAGCVNPWVAPEVAALRAPAAQCNYGVAVSKDGIFPCPILVDVPRARLSPRLPEALAQRVVVDYEFCQSCFATGTCCGQ